jgi:hypothetical protein
MPKKISIQAGGVEATATLQDTPTTEKIWAALPIEGRANTWGDEIYFSIPVEAPAEPAARAEVEVGDLGYWVDGKGFCIFFGPTPASTGANPVAASNVNVFGKLDGDATIFKSIPDGETVKIEKA